MLLNCNKSLRSRWARSQVCEERFRDALVADVLSVVQHPCQPLAHLDACRRLWASAYNLLSFSEQNQSPDVDTIPCSWKKSLLKSC